MDRERSLKSFRALRTLASSPGLPPSIAPTSPEIEAPVLDPPVAFMPPYNVVLHDDDDHTYEYVIEMLRAIFGFPAHKGHAHAKEVDTSGRTILLTTTREHAEFKQEQIHAYGPDHRLPRCAGSMTATIEPAF